MGSGLEDVKFVWRVKVRRFTRIRPNGDGFENCGAESPIEVSMMTDVCWIRGVKVAHVEAGLRSSDMEMPEEINRLFTTDLYANENLQQEGIAAEKVVFVGNVMIDTLLKHKQMAAGLDVLQKLGLKQGGYATLTMHRPSNVDDKATLEGILGDQENGRAAWPDAF